MKLPYGETPLSAVVADNVRLLCARRRLRQSALAELLGLSRMSISDRFRYKTPWTIDELGILARFFGVPPSVLLGEVPEPVLAVAPGAQLGALGVRRAEQVNMPPSIGQLLPGYWGRVG